MTDADKVQKWPSAPIGAIARIGNGSTPRRTHREYWESGTIPWLTSGKIHERRIKGADEFVTLKAASESHLPRIPPSSIVVAITGEGKTLGHCAIVGFEATLSQHLAYIAVDRRNIDPEFLFHYLDSKYDDLREAGQGGGTTKGALTCRFISGYEVPLPPLSEQRAIAAALSDADALVAALDALIAKKRAMKQGAMQQLLTGKTRLPGFEGEWESREIGDFTDAVAGGTPSTQVPAYWGGPILWMSSGELNQKFVGDADGHITERGLNNSNAQIVPAGCVLVGLAGQGKTRGTVAMNRVPLTTNQSIAAILPSESHVSEYLYYNLDSRYEELRILSAGDGGRGGLNLRLLRGLELPMPALKEQRAISTVLLDMDAEITALEARRDKANMLKEGMMQALLTGRVRLPGAAQEATA